MRINIPRGKQQLRFPFLKYPTCGSVIGCSSVLHSPLYFSLLEGWYFHDWILPLSPASLSVSSLTQSFGRRYIFNLLLPTDDPTTTTPLLTHPDPTGLVSHCSVIQVKSHPYSIQSTCRTRQTYIHIHISHSHPFTFSFLFSPTPTALPLSTPRGRASQRRWQEQ